MLACCAQDALAQVGIRRARSCGGWIEARVKVGIASAASEAWLTDYVSGFPPGPGLPLFFFELGAPLGLSELNAHQVAAVHMDDSGADLPAHLARRIHQRWHIGSILRSATAGGREHEYEDDGHGLVHGSPFRFRRHAAPELRELTSKRRIRAARPARCDKIPHQRAMNRAAWGNRPRSPLPPTPRALKRPFPLFHPSLRFLALHLRLEALRHFPLSGDFFAARPNACAQAR